MLNDKPWFYGMGIGLVLADYLAHREDERFAAAATAIRPAAACATCVLTLFATVVQAMGKDKLTPRDKRYTVNNNVNTTHNLLCALVQQGLCLAAFRCVRATASSTAG